MHYTGRTPLNYTPTPPPPSREAREELRRSITPSFLPAALPAFAQALEEERLTPVRPEVFFDLEHPPKVPDLTPEQRKTLFKQVFFEDSRTLEELEPFRIRVAYRIVREILRLRGTHTDESLASLAPDNKLTDPWTGLRTNAPRHFSTSPAAYGALPILDASDRLSPPGLPILPPPPPPTASVNYFPGIPDHDPRLHLYVNLLQTIATYLGIEHGTKLEPRLGKYGLLGLTNPVTIRLVFPTRLQLVQYERYLVQETLNYMVRVGRLGAERQLLERHGLADDEVMLLFNLASERATGVARSDVAQDKALMVLRLESLLERAREMHSFKAELAALKVLSIVQGLSRVEPEDINTEFQAVVEMFEDAPRPLELPGPSP